MTTTALHLMNPTELQHERQLARNNIRSLTRRLSHCPKSEVLAVEDALQTNREYVRTIEARLAWFERRGNHRGLSRDSRRAGDRT